MTFVSTGHERFLCGVSGTRRRGSKVWVKIGQVGGWASRSPGGGGGQAALIRRRRKVASGFYPQPISPKFGVTGNLASQGAGAKVGSRNRGYNTSNAIGRAAMEGVVLLRC